MPQGRYKRVNTKRFNEIILTLVISLEIDVWSLEYRYGQDLKFYVKPQPTNARAGFHTSQRNQALWS